MPVQLGKRNGRLIPLFSPQMLHPCEPENGPSEDFKPLVRELMYALNRTERRTWLLLLLGYSILDAAQQEGVSRPAIYARIRGSSKRHLGMIGKNEYVRIWWSNRKHLQTHDTFR